jgi:ATP-dependent helicase HrpA
VIRYPRELPIVSRKGEIVRAIQKHPVVIISGETGCGKSTQIPKMCLEAGRGRRGRIGCTQPRRIAAVTIAARIAAEMGGASGRAVGYKIRFDDRTTRETRVKILTDGMLLAETQSDPRLREYDTIIIDEAHERSLNIDFLLGIAKTLLPARPELKVIITSATLDIEKFRRAFDDAPALQVGGRMYPVDVEYRPPDPEDIEGGEADYVESAVKAVDRIRRDRPPGDVLVFMPTEQDILETCEILEGKRYAGVTVLPMFARLPAAEQGRVYAVTGPKIVVATNVAETSLTIPRIKYVVDTGLARIAQYLPGSRINSLPIRPISQSSADQRKGRCGRVQAGVCVRLYAEDDYAGRPRFTAPEILRSNLAEVILRMIDLKLGHPLKFPFVDRPNAKNVEDGYETLLELGAIRGRNEGASLTDIGRLMARMPLDPRISRILIEARHEGCVRDAAVIAAALSIRDPRERPPDKAAQADAMHAPFRHPDSDFLTLFRIWDRYHGGWDKAVSHSQKRKFCRDHFLSFARMREWVFVHNEIREILDEMRVPVGPDTPGPRGEFDQARYAAVHKSVLSGYLSNIAVHKDRNVYTAAKGREAMVFPGSTLFGKNASWIVAAEMVKTSRLFARTAARVAPEWLEKLGAGLCRSSYSSARWDKKRGEVIADETVTLFGLEIVSGRAVSYGGIDSESSQRIFIRSALLGGEVRETFGFLAHNLDLTRGVAGIEDKLRRREFLASDEMLAAFYSRRLQGVHDIRGLKERIRRRGGDGFLRMSRGDVLRAVPDEGELARFPDALALGGKSFEVSYAFAPGEDADGVTVKVPLALLNRVASEPLDWGVPGQFAEKIEAMIKGLPKRYRKLLVPANEKADAIVRDMPRGEEPLHDALARFVRQRFRADIPAAEWAGAEIPRHLRVRVAMLDGRGKAVAASRDLEELRRQRKEAAKAAASDPAVWARGREQWERTGIVRWDFGALPEVVSIGPGAVAFPGLEVTGNAVNLRLFKTQEEARTAHVLGVEALLLQKFSKDVKFMERHLALPPDFQRVALYFGGKANFEKTLLDALRRDVFRKNIRSEEEYKSYVETVVRSLFERAHVLWAAVKPVLDAYQGVRASLYVIEQSIPANKAVAAMCASIRAELERLVPADFPVRVGIDRLSHLARYVEALGLRAERAKNDPEKDKHKAAQAEVYVQALAKVRKELDPDASPEKRQAVEDFRWMVEEFKVSLFAPELKTAVPVSPQRLTRRLKEINRGT